MGASIALAGLTLAALVLAALTGYLLILSVAAVLRRRVEELSYAEAPVRRFAILIPAHNEAALIGRLLENAFIKAILPGFDATRSPKGDQVPSGEGPDKSTRPGPGEPRRP